MGDLNMEKSKQLRSTFESLDKLSDQIHDSLKKPYNESSNIFLQNAVKGMKCSLNLISPCSTGIQELKKKRKKEIIVIKQKMENRKEIEVRSLEKRKQDKEVEIIIID